MNDIEASKAVLLEVMTVLANEKDKIVVVGGWVPELAFPNCGHVGSLDVDLALDARSLRPMAYETVRNRLVGAGYVQCENPLNRFMRGIGTIEVKVDLITGEISGESHAMIQAMPVWKAHGIDLAFSHPIELKVEGALPGGAINIVAIRIPSVAAFVCIKAITMNERQKAKDAYDIYFCVSNFVGGITALAEQFRPLRNDPLAEEALQILGEKFRTINHVGPVWAAQVATDSAEEREIEQRRAFEMVNDLLKAMNSRLL